jgi:hypothetical protein
MLNDETMPDVAVITKITTISEDFMVNFRRNEMRVYEMMVDVFCSSFFPSSCLIPYSRVRRTQKEEEERQQMKSLALLFWMRQRG